MAEQDYVRLAAACHCGEPAKLWSGRGRPTKYCGEHDSPDKRGERKRAPRVKAERPPKPLPLKVDKECPACRGFFTATRKDREFCCHLCAVRARRGNKPRQLHGRECSVCAAAFNSLDEKAIYCSNRCKQVGWARKNPERAKAASQSRLCAYYACYCDGCGEAIGSRRPKKQCEGCAREQQLRAGREASYAINLARHQAAGKVVRCRGCRLEFCPTYGAMLMMTCPVCQPLLKKEMERATKDRRDKRIKSAQRETVVRRKVFERDGWMCRLCGIATPKELRGTYEHNAPELDHSDPVGRGGAHTYANTQCLCRSCNGWKGARTMGEALAALAL